MTLPTARLRAALFFADNAKPAPAHFPVVEREDLRAVLADLAAKEARIKVLTGALSLIADGTVGLKETHYEAQRRHIKTARDALSLKGGDDGRS